MAATGMLVQVINSTLPKDMLRLYKAMKDCEWRDIDTLRKMTGLSLTVISARLRDFRKSKFQRRHPELADLKIDYKDGLYRIDPESICFDVPEEPKEEKIPKASQPAPVMVQHQPAVEPPKEKRMVSVKSKTPEVKAPTAKAPRAKNTLTQVNFYHLCQHLEKDRENVPKFHASELAVLYTKKMELPITDNNVTAACKAIGVSTKGMVSHRKGSGTNRLEAVVRALCERLGEDFDALANGHE